MPETNVGLNVHDRIMLLGMLNQTQSNWTTLRLIREFQGTIGFSQDDIDEFNLVQEGNTTSWSGEEANREEGFDLPDALRAVIVAELQKLDAAGALTADHVSLCEKFLT